MSYSLKDKHVLIVGGSSDIAAALATDLLQEGARVTLAGRDLEKTAIAAKAIVDEVRTVALDLSDEESIQAAADQVKAAGGLDHLVSVAVERANKPVAASVSALASALAVELAPIRVNAVSPGVIATSVWNTAVPDKHHLFQRYAASAPARRVGEASDVSAAARALLINPFITGETLHVDGGARWA
jgi:NAD(P)-dependent dehydrogenase (short-subunit alcohol dehydrogenase family)